MLGKWIAEVWATGAEGAAKVFVGVTEKPGPNLMAALKTQATSLYRVTYAEWPTGHGSKLTPPEGPAAATSPPASPAPTSAPPVPSGG